MKNIIYRRDGELTNFSFYGTLILLGVVGYFILGSFFASLQDGMPLRAQ